MTASRYRAFVRQRMGVSYEAAWVRQIAQEAVRKAVRSKDNPADLINVALEELVRARSELPGHATLEAMTAAIRAEVDSEVFQAVAGRLEALIYIITVSRRSEFDRLKDVAKGASLGEFKGRLALQAPRGGGDAFALASEDEGAFELGEGAHDRQQQGPVHRVHGQVSRTNASSSSSFGRDVSLPGGLVVEGAFDVDPLELAHRTLVCCAQEGFGSPTWTMWAGRGPRRWRRRRSCRAQRRDCARRAGCRSG